MSDPGTAPVCNVRPQAPAALPSLAPLPAIPKATDLQSAITAINLINQLLRIVYNQIPNNNVKRNLLTGGGGGLGGNMFGNGQPVGGNPGGGSSPKQPKKNEEDDGEANFLELKERRVTKKVRVFDPDDHDVYVDVKQIVGLTFFNKKTKQYIKWERGPDGPAQPGDAAQPE